MFCPNCGKELGNNYKFCYECGFKIDFTIPEDEVKPVQQEPKHDVEVKPQVSAVPEKSKLDLERERRMRAAQIRDEQNGKRKKRGGIGREIRGKMRRAMLHWLLILVGIVLICFVIRSIHHMRTYDLSLKEYRAELSNSFLEYKINTRTNLDVVFNGYGKGFTTKGIYLSYTKAMREITPQLVEEYKTKADSGDMTVTELKELLETTIVPLADIAQEGEDKLDIMQNWSWVDYSEYSYFKKKLYEKYKEYALEVGKEYVSRVGDAAKKETADTVIDKSATVNFNLKQTETDENSTDTTEKADKSEKEVTNESVVENTPDVKNETKDKKEENDASGVDPKLKAFMDSYEAYIDEYVSFMKSYNASDINSLTKYSKMLEKYADFEKKVNAYDTKSMSQADLNYYTEVLNRCNKKLMGIIK